MPGSLSRVTEHVGTLFSFTKDFSSSAVPLCPEPGLPTFIFFSWCLDMWDPSSLTRGWTHTPCTGSIESSPLDRQQPSCSFWQPPTPSCPKSASRPTSGPAVSIPPGQHSASSSLKPWHTPCFCTLGAVSVMYWLQYVNSPGIFCENCGIDGVCVCINIHIDR